MAPTRPHLNPTQVPNLAPERISAADTAELVMRIDEMALPMLHLPEAVRGDGDDTQSIVGDLDNEAELARFLLSEQSNQIAESTRRSPPTTPASQSRRP